MDPRPCAFCQEPFVPKRTKQRFCGQRCANSEIASRPSANAKRSEALRGIPIPAERAARTAATLRQQAAEGTLAAQRPEVRAAQSATKKNQGFTPQLQKISAQAHADPEIRKRRVVSWKRTLERRYGVSDLNQVPGVLERASRGKSEAISRRLASGMPVNKASCYKQGWHESPIAGRQWYNSSWEKARMEALDTAGLIWTKNHGIRIPYRDVSDRLRYYIPDFLVRSATAVRLEEVKGYESLNVKRKSEAARSWCQVRGMCYVLLTSLEECQRAGLLDSQTGNPSA